MSVTLPFPLDLDAVAALCRRFHVKRLDVFGSAVAGGFDPARSDLDLLVEFEDLAPVDYADAYFGALEALEGLAGRAVDLVTVPSLRNPIIRQRIERERQALFRA